MRVLAEDSALALTFETDKPAEGQAPGLPDKLQFPPPPKSTATLSGRVTLSPPADLPGSASYVSYSVDGGAYSATTNQRPVYAGLEYGPSAKRPVHASHRCLR